MQTKTDAEWTTFYWQVAQHQQPPSIILPPGVGLAQGGPMAPPAPDLREITLRAREQAVEELQKALDDRWADVCRREAELRDQALRVGQRAKATGPYAVLHLQPDAPIEVVEATYRALSRKYHPDTNPNGLVKMQAINAAMEQIRHAKAAGR